MAGIDLAAAGGATNFLGRLVAAGTGLFLVCAKAMDEITEMSGGAGGGSTGEVCAGWLELYERIAGGHSGRWAGSKSSRSSAHMSSTLRMGLE